MPLLLTPTNKSAFTEGACELGTSSGQTEPITVEELQTQVKYYIDYMVKQCGVDPDKVFLAATIRVDTLLKIIASNPDCGGVRVYLTKDTPHDSGTDGDIWPLVVPVSRAGLDGVYTDLISNGDDPLENGLVTNFLCRNPPCLRPFAGSKLLPEGYKS